MLNREASLQEKMHFATPHLHCLKVHLTVVATVMVNNHRFFLLNYKARCNWSFPIGQIFHLTQISPFHLPLSPSLSQTQRPKLFISLSNLQFL